MIIVPPFLSERHRRSFNSFQQKCRFSTSSCLPQMLSISCTTDFISGESTNVDVKRQTFPSRKELTFQRTLHNCTILSLSIAKALSPICMESAVSLSHTLPLFLGVQPIKPAIRTKTATRRCHVLFPIFNWFCQYRDSCTPKCSQMSVSP